MVGPSEGSLPGVEMATFSPGPHVASLRAFEWRQKSLASLSLIRTLVLEWFCEWAMEQDCLLHKLLGPHLKDQAETSQMTTSSVLITTTLVTG